MRRIVSVTLLIGLALAVLIGGCGATYYRVPGRSVTAPLYDDADLYCASPQLMGPLPGHYRTLRRLVIQGGALVRTDTATEMMDTP